MIRPTAVPPPPPPEALEKTLFGDGQIVVTTLRIIIGSTTYALRNVSSVRMLVRYPSYRDTLLIAGFAFFLFVFSLIGFGSDNGGMGLLFLVCSAIVGAAAIISLRNLRTYYYVAISGSAGEVQALGSADRGYIERVVGFVNQAIVRYQ